ncbi:hypothetical protein K2F54_10655 [Cryobacterium sp. 1639]|nr:hypothetical protein [Cryobacterium sp. 1639]
MDDSSGSGTWFCEECSKWRGTVLLRSVTPEA